MHGWSIRGPEVYTTELSQCLVARGRENWQSVSCSDPATMFEDRIEVLSPVPSSLLALKVREAKQGRGKSKSRNLAEN